MLPPTRAMPMALRADLPMLVEGDYYEAPRSRGDERARLRAELERAATPRRCGRRAPHFNRAISAQLARRRAHEIRTGASIGISSFYASDADSGDRQPRRLSAARFLAEAIFSPGRRRLHAAADEVIWR